MVDSDQVSHEPQQIGYQSLVVSINKNIEHASSVLKDREEDVSPYARLDSNASSLKRWKMTRLHPHLEIRTPT